MKRGNLQDFGANVMCDTSTNTKASKCIIGIINVLKENILSNRKRTQIKFLRN